MGELRFLVPDRPPSTDAIATAFMNSYDDLPWVGEVRLRDELLTIERDESDSGVFNILWPVAGHGVVLLSTSTLMERPRPYLLPLELARGMLNRLRNHVAAWQAANLEPPAALGDSLQRALRAFVASQSQCDNVAAAVREAESSLSATLTGIDQLSAAVSERLIAARLRHGAKTMPLIGVRLGQHPPDAKSSSNIAAASNTVLVPFTWSHIESHEGRRQWSAFDAQLAWCAQHGLRAGGGPLVEFNGPSLPDWLYLWEGDYENLLAVATDHIRSVVARHQGKVAFWNVMSGLMTGETLGLDEEHKLRLAVKAIETVRREDAKTPIVMTFDQPCGEALAHMPLDLAPWHFADTLARGDIGLAGIGLQFTLGHGPRDTLPRDTLELGRHLDRWAGIGLPLLVQISIPSQHAGFTPERQQTWLEAYLSLFLGRPSVQAIIWNQLCDEPASSTPTSGLLGPGNSAKPALASLAAVRRKFAQ